MVGNVVNNEPLSKCFANEQEVVWVARKMKRCVRTIWEEGEKGRCRYPGVVCRKGRRSSHASLSSRLLILATNLILFFAILAP